jgi:membrane protein YqaA with SNARE-associated domain
MGVVSLCVSAVIVAKLTETISLYSLFLSSFLGATLLPGGSEAVLFGVMKLHPGLFWPAVSVATVGNTLGGMSSYLLGRLMPEKEPAKGFDLVQRYGVFALLLAWAPLIGDALCVAAGWLRLNVWQVVLLMAFGKFARYWVVAYSSGLLT